MNSAQGQTFLFWTDRLRRFQVWIIRDVTADMPGQKSRQIVTFRHIGRSFRRNAMIVDYFATAACFRELAAAIAEGRYRLRSRRWFPHTNLEDLAESSRIRIAKSRRLLAETKPRMYGASFLAGAAQSRDAADRRDA
jgi:hypothetical protein